MKKAIFVTGVLILLALSALAVNFVKANLLGVRPAVLPAPRDITESGSVPDSGVTGKNINSTNLPLSLPDGFSISVFAKGLDSPRVLRRDPAGTLVVSVPSMGKVFALPDKDGDGVSDTRILTAGNLNKPHGIAFFEGRMYIAETNQVAVYDYDPEIHEAVHKKKILDLPGGGNHYSRTLGFGPDGRLYITIGSSCNVCNESDFRRAKMFTSNPDGSGFAEYASGLRNSVFFTWHPKTNMLWATDMGRDLIGDDIPPDEINIIGKGKFYGWPVCYGKNIQDKTFDAGAGAVVRCKNAQASYIDIPAHSAPLGLAFVPEGSLWPRDYWNNLLVSYHGSWNRSQPTGYKIVRYRLDQNGVYLGSSDFLTGWLTNEGALGRPVDLLFDESGNLFVSDDKAGAVYKISAHPGR